MLICSIGFLGDSLKGGLSIHMVGLGQEGDTGDLVKVLPYPLSYWHELIIIVVDGDRWLVLAVRLLISEP
jgi:hypothetical protein